MAELNYPSMIPLMQRDKSRNESQTFINANPAAGAPFVQLITEDVSTEWPFTVRMTRGQAVVFQSWLRTADSNGDKPIDGAFFNMEVLVEFGLELQEIRFLAQPQISNVNGNFVTYQAQCITRSLNLGFDENDYETINELADLTCDGDYLQAAGILDYIATMELPNV